MAQTALKLGLPMAVVAVAVAVPLRGWDGGLTALGAVVVVIGSFYVTGRSLAWAAPKSLAVLQGVALGGLFLRLVLYALLIVLLRGVEAVDGPVLAITAAVAMVFLLAYETRFVLRTSQLWWLNDPVPGDVSTASVGTGAAGSLLGHGKDRP